MAISRRPQKTEEMFPDVVSALCEALTVSPNNCSISETFVVTSCATILDAVVDTQFDHPVNATAISTVDLAKEQSSNVTIGRVVDLLKGGYKPQNIDRKSESTEVSQYFRDKSKLSFTNNILYRSTVLNGVETEQLVLPVRFHLCCSICMMMSAIKVVIVLCLWFVPVLISLV